MAGMVPHAGCCGGWQRRRRPREEEENSGRPERARFPQNGSTDASLADVGNNNTDDTAKRAATAVSDAQHRAVMMLHEERKHADSAHASRRRPEDRWESDDGGNALSSVRGRASSGEEHLPKTLDNAPIEGGCADTGVTQNSGLHTSDLSANDHRCSGKGSRDGSRIDRNVGDEEDEGTIKERMWNPSHYSSESGSDTWASSASGAALSASFGSAEAKECSADEDEEEYGDDTERLKKTSTASKTVVVRLANSAASLASKSDVKKKSRKASNTLKTNRRARTPFDFEQIQPGEGTLFIPAVAHTGYSPCNSSFTDTPFDWDATGSSHGIDAEPPSSPMAISGNSQGGPPPLLRSMSSASMSSPNRSVFSGLGSFSIDDDDEEDDAALRGRSGSGSHCSSSSSNSSLEGSNLSHSYISLEHAISKLGVLRVAPSNIDDDDHFSFARAIGEGGDDENDDTFVDTHLGLMSPSSLRGTVDLRRGAARAALVPKSRFGHIQKNDIELIWRLVSQFLTVRDTAALGSLNKRWRTFVHCWPLRLDTLWPPRPACDIVRDMKNKHRRVSGVRLSCGLGSELFRVVEPSHLVFLHVSGLGLKKSSISSSKSLDLRPFTCLQELRLDDLPQVTSLQFLEPCARSLRALRLRRCTYLRDISAFESIVFPKLTSLEIRDCRLVEHVSSISKLSGLKNLALSGLDRVSDIAQEITGCAGLLHLSISRCSEVRSLDGLKTMSMLIDLELTHLPSLRRVPDELASWCPRIRSLNLTSCPGVQLLPSLASLSRLETLNVSNTRILDLEFIRNSLSVRRIDAAFCFRLVSIGALATAVEIRSVSLRFCHALRDISALVNCKNLRWIDLTETKAPREPVANVVTVITDKSAGLFASRPQLPLDL
mmetsp:Transcript_22005/g.43246  ORF Transcript_22005/g.43246 Transcript_22005/m.43246 type:complete len:887 (-) Transcript_22005:136-2796(-)